jgi:hypothetical protein
MDFSPLIYEEGISPEREWNSEVSAMEQWLSTLATCEESPRVVFENINVLYQ